MIMETLTTNPLVFPMEPTSLIGHCGSSHAKQHDHPVEQAVPFPWKLHEMLEDAETSKFTNLVSWLPDNHSFRVHNPDAFVKQIMPRYFRQTKYKSFQRQLNMWGFERLISGPHKGGYSHVAFVRGQPSLCRRMKRLKIKGTGNSPNTSKSSMSSLLESASRSREAARQEASRDRKNEEPVLFDEETLLSIFSNAVDNSSSNFESAPREGDCVLFEGMQFYFVEDYNNASSSRRCSIELMGSNPSRRRRFSLVGSNAYKSMGMGRRFSIEAAQHPFKQKVHQGRARHRYSIERGMSKDLSYVLKELIEL